ncbi:RNA 2'-phosphotransferase [Curtobacterium sp. MCSS17_016]|uniref:RNA 2'-phosphotransferase n=1 Tax=Curtobacterium sp. MCSS17_016 TaxID=2175644 RepID=UPI0015E8DE6A|nr:RNA 2'-phosphotransferase [Curtobacterium sp. MCSS17_016]WIE81299.1 RNA 2'-phosphotransferase [Curtobacterium sp. MCSS17_016]
MATVNKADVRLSKTLSRALRHAPRDFGLELAADGSVPLRDLVAALQSSKQPATEDDIRRVIAQSDKQRFAIDGDRIRAQYGHSVADRIVKQPYTPTGPLFHATSPAAVNLIVGQRLGLQPMGRQYVHLTTDADLALDAGRRKAPHPLLLEVDAVTAHTDGVPFYVGHDRVVLADEVPARYLTVRPLH